MTIERPMFPPRAKTSALRLVGGINFTQPETEALAAPRKRKREVRTQASGTKLSIRTGYPSSIQQEKKILFFSTSQGTELRLRITIVA